MMSFATPPYVRRLASATALGAAALATPVHAHVVLDTKTAAADSEFVALFNVGHGCSGRATTALEVTLPDDVTVLRVPDKAGWTVSTLTAASPRRVIWTGGPLAADAFDQFEVVIRTPSNPGTRFFRALQRCGEASIDWSGIPAPGQSRRDLKTPAAMLEVVPRR